MTVTVSNELEKYVLEQEIGRGDLTIVYQGRRKVDGSAVAIKVVGPQFTFDELFVRRFLDMAKQAARLDHHNIVRTYEARFENGMLYLVRELVESRPLADVLAEEELFTPRRMLNIAQQIAAALDYAHQKSIMHGDLSARRVYLGTDDRVIVTDFSQTQTMVGTSLVNQGFAVGTPEVLAPERVHKQGPSRQSDLYSLGILCYQMLNGAPPFEGEPAAVLHAQAYEQPKPLHLANPGVSLRLSEVIGRMLSKGLELRYTTGSEYIRALTAAAEGTAPMPALSATSRDLDIELGAAPPFWQRSWLWALIAVPAIVLLIGAGFFAVSAGLSWLPDTGVEIVDQTLGQSNAAVEAAPAVENAAQNSADAGTEIVLVETTTTSPDETNSGAALSPTALPEPLPTPGPPVIASSSPFTDLQLAHGIAADSQPEERGFSFAPGTQPIYLFFDYGGIEPGTVWSHRWSQGDVELEFYEEVWSDSYAETGTAWVYYSPSGGYQPGLYQVTLAVDGQVVATASFVVQPGGI